MAGQTEIFEETVKTFGDMITKPCVLQWAQLKTHMEDGSKTFTDYPATVTIFSMTQGKGPANIQYIRFVA